MGQTTDAVAVTVTSTRLIVSQNGLSLVFGGQDIIRAEALNAPSHPSVNTVPNAWFIRLYLTGPIREVYPIGYYDILLNAVSSPSTWNDKVDPRGGALVALAAITPMIRSTPSGGSGGQVDTIVPGAAIDVDSTDPVNPIVNVKVDGVTIGINGLNELEVPAGGGGYVPTTRLINTTAPISGGGDLSANRTISIPQATAVADGFLDSADWTTFNNKGDVNGPVSSVDDNIALFDGVTGKLIKDAGINLSEIIEEDPGPGIGMIESGAGVSPIILKNVKDGIATQVVNNTGSVQVDVLTENSVEISGSNRVALVGDEASPGNSEYYGTNGAGTKGFYPLPTDTGITQLTGDVTAGPGSGSQVATLASVIAAGGPTGSATATPIITYDAKGRLTTVSSATVTPAIGSITGLGTGVATALAINIASNDAVMIGRNGVEAAYTGTLTWTGTAPSGSADLRQYYTQVGNLVTFYITLTYGSAGIGITNVTLTFPTEFPTPDIPTGMGIASARIYPMIGRANTTMIATPIALVPQIARNAGDTAFEIIHNAFASGNYRSFLFQGSYFTS